MSVLYTVNSGAGAICRCAAALRYYPRSRAPVCITVVGRVCCRSIVDIIKLLGRQSVGPDASGWVFRLTPYVMVGVMLTIVHCAAGGDRRLSAAATGRFDHLTVSLRHRAFLFAISGLDTGSPFTAIGASREAMLGVLVEPMLLLGLWVAAQAAGSTNISNITDTVYHWPLSQSIPLVLALCACAFATLRRNRSQHCSTSVSLTVVFSST